MLLLKGEVNMWRMRVHLIHDLISHNSETKNTACIYNFLLKKNIDPITVVSWNIRCSVLNKQLYSGQNDLSHSELHIRY